MMTDEQKAEALAKQAQGLALMSVIFSTCAAAWLADRAFGDGAFTVSSPSAPMIGGAVAGLLLGLALRFLDREDRRRTVAAATLNTPPAPPRIEWLPLAMIALATGAGLLMWWHDALGLTIRTVVQISIATIAATALLGHFDLRLLLLRHPEKNPHPADIPSPVVGAFALLLGLWAVMFPLHFVIRRRYGGRNLIVPGLLAAAVALSPVVYSWFAPPELPRGNSPDVLAVVRRAYEENPEMPAELRPFNVVRFVEESFDPIAQRRTMTALLATPRGEFPIRFVVSWQDRKAGMFQVEFPEDRP